MPSSWPPWDAAYCWASWICALHKERETYDQRKPEGSMKCGSPLPLPSQAPRLCLPAEPARLHRTLSCFRECLQTCLQTWLGDSGITAQTNDIPAARNKNSFSAHFYPARVQQAYQGRRWASTVPFLQANPLIRLCYRSLADGAVCSVPGLARCHSSTSDATCPRRLLPYSEHYQRLLVASIYHASSEARDLPWPAPSSLNDRSGALPEGHS